MERRRDGGDPFSIDDFRDGLEELRRMLARVSRGQTRAVVLAGVVLLSLASGLYVVGPGESYEKIFQEGATVVQCPDADLLRYLYGAGGR